MADDMVARIEKAEAEVSSIAIERIGRAFVA
jgi:hypothetical protein